MRLDSNKATFLMFSGATYVELEKARHREFGASRAQDVTDPSAMVRLMRFDMSQLRYDELDPGQLEFLLLTLHERDHFDRFFGSPLGLLIYRSYLTINVTLNWLFERFFIPGKLADEACGGPFIDWIRTDALEWIRQKLASGEIEFPPSVRDHPQPIVAIDGFLAYVDEIALTELLVLSEFVRALMSRTDGMTMGEFAALANRAFHHLSMRCDMPTTCKWTTDFPDEPLHPNIGSTLTTTELLELAALGSEAGALERCSAPQVAIDQWFAAYTGDPYAKGLELVRSSGAPIKVLGQLAGIALRSPCDLVVCPEGELRVEAVHPTWRFHAINFQLGDPRDCERTGKARKDRVSAFFHTLRDHGWGAAESALCANAPMGPMPEMASVVPGKSRGLLVGLGANLLPTKREKRDWSKFDLRHAVADMFDVFRAGMAAAVAWDHDAMRAIRERLVYYQDEAAFPNLSNEEDLHTALIVHASCIVGYMHLLNLFDGLDASDVPPWDEACFARLSRFAPNADLSKFRSIFGIDHTAAEVFGAPYAQAMGFNVDH